MTVDRDLTGRGRTLGEAGESRTFYVTKDGQKILEGRAYDIGENPFKRELVLLKTDFRPSMGSSPTPCSRPPTSSSLS